MLLWTLITASLFGLTLANPCADLSEQGALDECYMRSALDLALERNPRAPFGTVIVDHTTNKISCYGVNSNYHNILMHGETAAFWNCTDLNPSPTGNDLSNPGLDWTRQTLYTTGQPCPACSAHIVYRNVGRVVWGSSMEYMITTGRQAQLTLDIEDMVNSAVMVGSDTPKKLPILEGGVLKDECDHVFWCAFKEFRDTAYYEAMKAAGKEDYVIMQDQRFPCATIPFRRQQ